MVAIDVDHIAHSYRQRPTGAADFALKEVATRWEDGGAYALLGPSGCGKTTMLNIISGLVTPTSGRILFGGRDVTHLPTEARNIAQVFQFPVIYDTMTVYDNLAFPLRNRRMARADVDRRVREVIDMLGLGDKARRRAHGLTADDKQKISLGRGLVRPDVSAILLDEPLTVIDPHLKWVLRSQLKHLHKRFGFTMIYVTHDQTEALTFADRVAVMSDGEIVQIGTPEELFARPAHTFVGYFIGSPGMNVLPCSVEGATARVAGHAVPLPRLYGRLSGTVEIGVRPEFVRIAGGGAGLPLEVRAVEDIGRHRILRGRVNGHAVNAILPEDAALPDKPRVVFDPAGINIYVDAHRVAGEG